MTDTKKTTVVQQEQPVPKFSVYDELKDLIEPSRHLIETKGLWDGLMTVFSTVEKYGSYPSVVLKDDSIEYRDDVLAVLKHVTLKEHSVAVTRLFIQNLNKNFKDTTGLIFTATVAGLMHDIGKAEPLRTSVQYSKYDHPVIGADIVKSIFPDGSVYEVNKAIEIIKDHHRASKDTLTGLLQEADELARIEELKRHDRIVKNVEEALTAGDILQLIDPFVNAPKSDSEWGSFSFKSVIYVDPDFLYDLLLREASAKGIVLSGQIRQISKPVFMKNVVKVLKDAKMLADNQLTYDYYSWYEIVFSNTSKKMKLIPLQISAFGALPSVYEERKLTQSRSGLLKFISDVKKLSGKKV